MAKKTGQLPTFVDPEQERWKREFPRFPGVQKLVALLRSPNVQGTWIDIICHELTAHAAETLEEIESAYRAEPDAWVRVMLISSLAEAGLPEAVSFLAECLSADDERVRVYAACGLRAAGTKEARTILWQTGIATA